MQLPQKLTLMDQIVPEKIHVQLVNMVVAEMVKHLEMILPEIIVHHLFLIQIALIASLVVALME